MSKTKTKKPTLSRPEPDSERNLFYLQRFYKQTIKRLGLEKQFEKVTGEPFPSNRGAWRRIAAEYDFPRWGEDCSLDENAVRDWVMGQARRDKKLRPPPTMRKNCDELADLIVGVVQAAALAMPGGASPAPTKLTPAMAEFRRSIDLAIDSVDLLDGLARPIRGVAPQEWQDGLRAALLRLKAAYIEHGHKLFGESGVLHLLLKDLSRYNSDLRRLHVSQDTDAAKSKATGRGRRRATRKARPRRLTDKEIKALTIFTRVKTYTATAEELGISRQGATELVKLAQEKTAAIAAEANRIQGERSSGRSVNLARNLRHGKRGEPVVAAPEHRDG